MALSLINALKLYIRWIDALNENLGKGLAWCLPGMTAITLAVIFFSFFFRQGWIWLSEIVIYLHGVLFTLTAGYTLLHDDHVRIDVFYDRFSPTGRAWVNLAGVLLLLLPACVVIIIYSTPYVAASWSVLETSSEGEGLPAVFLLKTCLLLMPALLILQGLSLAAKSGLLLFAPAHVAAGFASAHSTAGEER